MRKLKKGPVLWLVYFLLFAVAACMLFPFIWMVISSFKTPVEILAIPPTFFPKEPTLENYQVLWEKFDFARFFCKQYIHYGDLRGSPAVYGFSVWVCFREI
ncbi:MAG: hypothetical protein ACLSA0_07740 [Eisenbergiella massiliensis]